MDLIDKSKQVILDNQHSDGAFIASPTFEHYRYCWLRDSTFIAYSLDCVNAEANSLAFYRWGIKTIERYREKALHAITLATSKGEVTKERFLHARYTVKGEEVAGNWGTYQLDGYGSWLWGVKSHVDRWGNEQFASLCLPTVHLIVEYLLCMWQKPNFDCWEEFGDFVHPSTIAAIYGGIKAVLPWLKGEIAEKSKHELGLMTEFLVTRGASNGRFTKYVGTSEIDASLLWLHVPYYVVNTNHPLMKETVKNIEESLLVNGGVHRYLRDTYYGGGQWILLTAWLGWHYLEIGELEKAKKLLQWIEQQFDKDGFLPEQTAHHILDHNGYKDWFHRVGPPAKPLLWSHAMYIILRTKWEKVVKKSFKQ